MIRVLPLMVCLGGLACGSGDPTDISDVMELPPATGTLHIQVFPVDDDDLMNYSQEMAVDGEMRITLVPPITLSGTVVGEIATPWKTADTPAVESAIAGAKLVIHNPDQNQSRFTFTDQDGTYALRVHPSETPFRIQVIPTDALAPLFDGEVLLTGSETRLDIDIGHGVPVYGQLTQAPDDPINNATVYAVHTNGEAGPSTTTNNQGWYQLHVSPESQVQVVMVPNQSDIPQITSPPLAPTEQGAEWSLALPTSDTVLTQGRVITETRAPIDNAFVHFQAISLFDYSGQTYQHLISYRTNTQGEYAAWLPPGTYRVTAMANDAESAVSKQRSAVDLGVQTLSQPATLPTIVLPSLDTYSGSVTTRDNEPIENALITCTEQGFLERRFQTVSGGLGQFAMALPNTPLTCQLSPPINRPDLALAYVDLTANSGGIRLSFGDTYALTGTVLRVDRWSDDPADATNPVANAILEVRDDSDRLLGTAFTDNLGQFRMAIQLD